MKKEIKVYYRIVFTLLFVVVYTTFSFGQNLSISQYIETNSGTTPKGVEIYNGTGLDIVLSSSNYLQIYKGANGAACSALLSTKVTSGTLKNGEVWVIGTSDLTSYATSNGTNLSGTTTYNFAFNGDDALELYLGSSLQDVFGTCGSDPGSSWSNNGVSTANQNIQIKTGVCSGTTTYWTDPSIRFDYISVGTTMTGFGDAPTCNIPTLSVSNSSITGYSYIFGDGPSTSQSFDLSGSNLDGTQVTISAPANYEISDDNTTFSQSDITVSYTAPTLNATTIYVRLKSGLAVGLYNGENITCVDDGSASDVTVSNDGEVYESIISVSPTSITGLDYIAGGGPSTAQSYSLSGSNLLPASGDITVTAPTNFEVATSSGGTYSSSLTVSYTSNTLSTTDIFVRLKSGLSVGAYGASNITNTGGNAITKNVSVSGNVTNPTVNFSVTSASVSENGTSYTIDVTSNTIWSHTVDIIINGGTATNGNEYTFSSPVTADFSSSTTFSTTVTINDEATCNGNTNVIFELSNNLGCDIGTSNQLDLTIDDDEMENGEYIATKFEGSDTWGYTANGSIQSDINKYNDNNSYRLEGSDNITFDDVNITGFSDVEISVAYASSGVDSGEDLFMSVSYDGGSTYTDYKLIDGYSNYSLDINQTGTSTETPQGANPFVLSISSSETSVKVKFWTTGIDAGEYFYVDDIVMTRTSCNICSEPTIDASFDSGSPSSLDETTATLDWTIGDGQNRIVVLRENLSVAFSPTDNSTYVANSSFGSGTDVGTNEYVVYNGNSNTVDVTNLTSGTEYFSKIFEYSCNAGSEDYYTTGTPTIDTFITVPNDPVFNTAGCSTNSTIDLSWSAATGNSTGYLLVVREGSLSPHTVTSFDPGTNLGENLDYTLAAQFGSTTPYSRMLYKGTGTSATVTGLSSNTDYIFKLYTYTIGSSGYVYSVGTQQTNTISIPDVSSESVNCDDSQSSVAWANPTSSCFDEILVVTNETSGIDFSPSGDGSSYIANSVYSSPNDVVYKGTGTTVNVTNLVNGTTYYFEIFVRKGTEWSQGIEVSCTPNEVTTLYPGDLAIIAINTQYLSSGSDDEVCFISFKDITNGTAIDFTDNGYEREVAGKWGGYEGTIRLERTGGTIEKGTVICVQGYGNANGSGSFSVKTCGTNDDANWTISCLNYVGSTYYSYDLNSADQIWIMQGGNWTNPGGEGAATYDGNVLYGWTATDWKTAPGYSDSKGSTLFDGADCFNTNVTGTLNEYKVKFFSDTSQTLSQAAWIGEINSSGNWTGYSDNTAYNSGGLDYSGSCIKFKIDNSLGTGAGKWQGGEDNNWFNCANWLNMQVPNETVDVTILANAENIANIDDTQEDANLYGPIAKCKNLTIEDGGDTVSVVIDDANDELQVKETLTFESNGKLYNIGGGTLTVDGNIIINDGALLDMHNVTAAGSVLNLKGNWTDNNIIDDNTQGFYETDSKVIFIGIMQQTITDATGNETFFDVQMNNSNGLDLNGNDATINGTLDLTLGDITTGSNNVIINNTVTTAITNNSTTSYINGNLRRYVNTTGSYDFPIGTSLQYEYSNINLNSSSGITYFDSKFTNPVGTIDITSLGLTVDGTSLVSLLDYGFWTISPDAVTSVDYDVTLISIGHTNGASLATQHAVVKRHDSSVDWEAFDPPFHDNATQFGTGTNPITAKLSNLTTFSDYAIARSQNFPLPVELIEFNAKPNNGIVEINWITMTEINNDYFVVERSFDGIYFSEINRINGAGNSNSTINYNTVDKKPKTGYIYYRLKQVDFNGDFTFSNIKVVKLEKTVNDFSVNSIVMSNNNVNINVDSNEPYNIEIYSTNGKILYKKLNVNQSENIDISQFTNGVYLLKLSSKNTVITKKIIK